jgi:DNA-binding NtrC family response regulator
MTPPRSRRKLIVLETDRPALSEVLAIARSWYDVLSTSEPRQAKAWLSAHADIAVFVTDHSAQIFEGKSLLEQVKTQLPDVRRVVLTSYSDLSTLIEGLHNGAIQKLVQKPIDRNELAAAIAPIEALVAATPLSNRPVAKVG